MTVPRALAELGMTWPQAGLTVVTAAGVYVAMIVCSRVFGQRQLATSSSYDMAFTFALGSIVGRVILVRTSLATALVGLLTMFVLHSTTGWLHHHVGLVHRIIQNRPVLLAVRGRTLDDNLRRARTSHAELYQQIRLAGLGSLSDVEAVILERNGQMSVLPAGTAIEARVVAELPDGDRLVQRRA